MMRQFGARGRRLTPLQRAVPSLVRYLNPVTIKLTARYLDSVNVT